MRTVAFVADNRGVYCCPTCALTEGAQMRQAVRFEPVAGYETGHPLRPADAFAVEDSGVIPCLRPHGMVNRDGPAVPMDFDRRSPGIIAFANLAGGGAIRRGCTNATSRHAGDRFRVRPMHCVAGDGVGILTARLMTVHHVNCLMAGMAPVMTPAMKSAPASHDPSRPAFWFIMSMALLVGFIPVTQPTPPVERF